MPPLVSVIIPIHNRAGYVVEAVESVLQQTFRDFEIVVVDDGSTDETKEALRGFIAHGDIRYLWQQNAGTASARNAGIKAARGRYIAFLDSDDLFLPTKLEKQVDYLRAAPEVRLVHTYFSKFNNSGEEMGLRKTDYFSGDVYPHLLLHWNSFIPPSTAMVRKEVFQELSVFDESLLLSEDLDMWRRIARRFDFHVLGERLVKLRVHSGNKSGWSRKSAGDFRPYLEKAFADDPSLSPIFQRRAWAKMYTNVALYNVGEGKAAQMSEVRKNALRGLAFWPFEPGAYLAFGGSLLNFGLRKRLVEKFRQMRYSSQ